jgi:Arc/MetJ-type ribon-helix-helix transcriptional regulator
MKVTYMSVSPETSIITLEIPERTLGQLDELVQQGRFTIRQTTLVAAIERLYTITPHQLTARQEALTRLCGALHLGTLQHSLRAAERDRLAWESGQR